MDYNLTLPCNGRIAQRVTLNLTYKPPVDYNEYTIENYGINGSVSNRYSIK